MQFVDALNGTLTSPPALAGPMPPNLRSAADVYSQDEVDTMLSQLVLDVKKMGAAGDGVTNDAPAIQAVINIGIAAGGATILFPDGVYLLNTCLTGGSYLQFRGSGRAVLRLSAAPVYNTYRSMLQFVSNTGFSVSGLELDSSFIVTFTGGYRDFFALGCTNFYVRDNTFISAGAATACLGSSNYKISRNVITCDPSDGVTKHDGVIDQWEGSHDFIITDNMIDGDNIGRYGILATGTATDNSPAACYNFIITNNIIKRMKFVGIWINGRNGVNYAFSVKDNIVDGVAEFYGIGIMDVYDFSVTSNKVRNTFYQGIIITREGTSGTYGARDGFIAFNNVRNTNLGAGAAEMGWAISSAHADNSKLVFAHNIVRGTMHTYGMGVRGTDIKVIGRDFDYGTLGNINNYSIIDSGTRTEKGYWAYTPTVANVSNVSAVSVLGANYKLTDGYVDISGRLSVTPAVAASTNTQVSISLPVPSNFGSANSDAQGTASSGFGVVGEIFADAATDLLILRFPAPNTAANSLGFIARYKVI